MVSIKQKGLAAVCIFILMVSGSLVGDKWIKRVSSKEGLNSYDPIEIQSLDTEYNFQTAPFRSREYIRIVPR